MPARLSPSPPVSPRLPISSEAMSLVETSRPAPESRLLRPSLSYMADSRNTRSLRHATFGATPMARPLSETWHPDEAPNNSRQRDLGHVLESIHHSRPDSASSLSRMTAPSHSSQSPILAGSAHLEQYQRTASFERLESNTLPTAPVLEREGSKEKSYTDASTLRSSSHMHKRPLTALQGNPEVMRRKGLHEMSPRDDNSRKMGISNLIVKDDISTSRLYDLVIRQQPVAARACGFGDRDRRVVDPPPILQMVLRDPKVTPAELATKIRYPFSVIYCELWNAEQDHEETSMPEVGDRPHGRRLMGTLVSSPFVGRDESGEEGCFFPFPDLSCRTTGRYRLRFVLMVLNPANMKPGEKLPFQATVLSDIFEVYPAKTFPGMVQSTKLAKCLKDQGCLISVKKGQQRREMSTGPSRNIDQEEDILEDNEADSLKVGREKRQKT